MDNEQALIQRAQKGNQDAFAALVDEHQHYVYNLALRLVKDENEALDLTQETFVRAWTALPNFRRQSQFRTWLYRIVTNLCYNRLPGLRRALSESAAFADQPMDPEVEAIHSALVEALRSAFPPKGGMRLVSVQPYLMSAFNQWRSAVGKESAR